jgi:hypothetical protein
MTKHAFVLALASTGHTHRATPAGWFLAVVVLLVVLYMLWRSGHLRRLLGAIGERRMTGSGRRMTGSGRGLPEGVRVRPVTLLPLALLLIVIAVLVISH